MSIAIQGQDYAPHTYPDIGKTATDTKEAFSPKVMKCVQSGNQKVYLCSDALMSYALPNTGESINIYRADSYSEENRMYLIKGLDAEGNAFEMEVDAGEIDPNHCSYNEFMILNIESGHTSPKDYMRAVVARDNAGAKSSFEKANYMYYAKMAMNQQKQRGDYASYLAYGRWIQDILDYVNGGMKR